MTFKDKLDLLRAQLEEKKLGAWLVTVGDPHASEYIADRFAVIPWLTGFKGSAGTLAVTKDQAALWVDSRYWLEAEQVLPAEEVRVMKHGDPETPPIAAWLAEQLMPGTAIGCAQAQSSPAWFGQLAAAFETTGLVLEAHPDLIDAIWSDRPALPGRSIVRYQPSFDIPLSKEKIERVQAWLDQTNIHWLLVGALDEIAWLLNLRGSDIECNPVFYAWLLIGRHGSTLFVVESALDPVAAAELAGVPVSLAPYEAITPFLQTLASEDRLLVARDTVSLQVYGAVRHMRLADVASPVALWKAVKAETELAALDECLGEDCAALATTFYWVHQQVTKKQAITEIDVANQLRLARSNIADFRGESFPAIVGAGEHGAIVHYRATAETAAAVDAKAGLVLVDSGGQYERGTSDITRVLALASQTTADQRLAYTLVLKGHIALASAVFPVGTSGSQLDILARQALWEKGWQYGHGTGHGIGFYLNVHEGPQRISGSAPPVPLLPGMIVSNEPGYYAAGSFGIRLENMMTVEPHPELTGFLRFRLLTWHPFEGCLIEASLLAESEKTWLEAYTAESLKRLKPRLGAAEYQWVADRALPAST